MTSQEKKATKAVRTSKFVSSAMILHMTNAIRGLLAAKMMLTIRARKTPILTAGMAPYLLGDIGNSVCDDWILKQGQSRGGMETEQHQVVRKCSRVSSISTKLL